MTYEALEKSPWILEEIKKRVTIYYSLSDPVTQTEKFYATSNEFWLDVAECADPPHYMLEDHNGKLSWSH